MKKYFGTDGIRDLANSGVMTADTILRFGIAVGRVFRRGNYRHRVVIGKDTRLSGYMVESALIAGFTSMGMDTLLFGPIPTPAVAFLTRSLRADIGVMISASHNHFRDNGVKLFGPDGHKLSDELEAEIEYYMEEGVDNDMALSEDLGRVTRVNDAQARYIEFAKRSVPRHSNLNGLKVVIDCANGAAYKVVPTTLWELGADLVTIGDNPNGVNINEGCGSTDTSLLQKTVVEEKADIGIALDGDSDRLLVCDEKGHMIDGDQILGMLARDWQERDMLSTNSVIATIMSNLELERYLNGHKLNLTRTPVGDRYVMQTMCKTGANLGGEQSGHVIIRDFSTTGDGLITALQVLTLLKRRNRPMSEIGRVFHPLPQILENIHYTNNLALDSHHIQNTIIGAENSLGKKGRILVRKSGTEPVIRVMAEGDDMALVKSVVKEVSASIREVSI